MTDSFRCVAALPRTARHGEMAVQLPSEASGVVAGVLVYSFFCLACGLFLLWLVWVHNERKSCKHAARFRIGHH